MKQTQSVTWTCDCGKQSSVTLIRGESFAICPSCNDVARFDVYWDSKPAFSCAACGERDWKFASGYSWNCGACGVKSPPYLHLNPSNKVLPPDKQEVLANEDELRVTKIAFELLPKGTWDIEDLISHFRGAAKHNPGVFNESAFEWERIVRLKSLRPIECFIGTEAWFGYIVLTFSYSSKVVLECPMEGNATYVLTRYWRQMVRHTKGEMRSKFPGQFTRIVHRGDWLGRIKSAIEI